MNIQAEKIELIKLIADVKSEKVIKKIKDILTTTKKADETDRLMANPVMVKRLQESKKQIKEGEGIKIELEDLWK